MILLSAVILFTSSTSTQAQTKQNSLTPGYIDVNLSPGEQFEFTITYTNQDSEDLVLSSVVYELKKDDATGKYAPVLSQSLQSWIEKTPNLIAKAGAETKFKFRLGVPNNAEFRTYVPVISLVPQAGQTGESSQAQARFGLSTVVYVNVLSAKDKVSGIGSSNAVEFSKFKVKFPIVFSLDNEVQYQIKNASGYAQVPAGKYLVFASDGSVYPQFGQLNPESQRLLSGDELSENLSWSANSLDLWSKLLYTGTQKVEARIRIGNTNQYVVAKTEFFYISGEWVIIIAVLCIISLRLAITYRRRRLQKIVGKLSKAALH